MAKKRKMYKFDLTGPTGETIYIESASPSPRGTSSHLIGEKGAVGDVGDVGDVGPAGFSSDREAFEDLFEECQKNPTLHKILDRKGRGVIGERNEVCPDYGEFFKILMQHKDILPLLMGINSYLDKMISDQYKGEKDG